MIEFDIAQQRLAAAGKAPTATETIPLNDCSGRILAQSVIATINMPPADNSAMDGYAIRFSDYKEGKPFEIQQRAYAGDTPEPLQQGKVIRLFTGSIMPEGADTVVMQEYATETDDTVVFETTPELGTAPQQHQHVRYRGEDVKKDTTLIEAGSLIGPGEISLLASQGTSKVQVFPKLKVGILTTGDELVQPGETRAPEQIFNSNGHMLASMVKGLGAITTHILHAADTPESISEAFNTLVEDCDITLTIGGVSVGDKDLVKPTIESLGGKLDLWQVRMKPGKPVALAHIKNKPIVCLPGNPVSAFVVFTILVTPLVRAMQGNKNIMPQIKYGTLNTTRKFKGWREDFIRVKAVNSESGKVQLEPHVDQGSAIVSSLAWSTGLARIPADTPKTGEDTVAYYDFANWLKP